MSNELEGQMDAGLQELKRRLDQWQEGLDQLIEVGESLSGDAKTVYQNELAALQERLHHMKVRVLAMAEGNEKERREGEVRVQERLVEFREAFFDTAHRLENEVGRSLDWLPRFIEERTTEQTDWSGGTAV